MKAINLAGTTQCMYVLNSGQVQTAATQTGAGCSAAAHQGSVQASSEPAQPSAAHALSAHEAMAMRTWHGMGRRLCQVTHCCCSCQCFCAGG